MNLILKGSWLWLAVRNWKIQNHPRWLSQEVFCAKHRRQVYTVLFLRSLNCNWVGMSKLGFEISWICITLVQIKSWSVSSWCQVSSTRNDFEDNKQGKCSTDFLDVIKACVKCFPHILCYLPCSFHAWLRLYHLLGFLSSIPSFQWCPGRWYTCLRM